MKTLKNAGKALIKLTPTAPFFILAICFLGLPFISMVVRSFTDEKTGLFTLANYKLVFTKASFSMAVTNSLRISLIATAIAMVISFFVAMAIYSIGLSSRKWFLPILNVSQDFAGFPLAFAFILMLGTQGFIRLALKEGGIGILDNYKLMTYNGMIPVYVWFGIPLGTLLMLPGFEGIKNEWREASALLNCSNAGFWFRIGIPNLIPTLLGTMSIVFADSITTYSTIYVTMGGSALVLPVKIGHMFSGDLKASEEVGCALSIILILIILAFMLLCNLGKRMAAKRGVSA